MIHPFAELSEERPQVGLSLFLSGAVQLPLHAPFHVVLSGIQLLSPNSQEELQGASTSVSWCHLVTSPAHQAELMAKQPRQSEFLGKIWVKKVKPSSEGKASRDRKTLLSYMYTHKLKLQLLLWLWSPQQLHRHGLTQLRGNTGFLPGNKETISCHPLEPVDFLQNSLISLTVLSDSPI